MNTDKKLVDLVGEMLCLESGSWDFDYERGDGPYESYVEREVRKRIEYRGWLWRIEGDNTIKHGFVFSNQGYNSTGQTAAIALITAYISALEALNADARQT